MGKWMLFTELYICLQLLIYVKEYTYTYNVLVITTRAGGLSVSNSIIVGKQWVIQL